MCAVHREAHIALVWRGEPHKSINQQKRVMNYVSFKGNHVHNIIEASLPSQKKKKYGFLIVSTRHCRCAHVYS